MTDEQITKQELRRREIIDGEAKRLRGQSLRMVLRWMVVFAAIGILAWILYTIVQSQPRITSNDIISRNGIHWHPHLRIVINGKEETIPAGVGLGAVHAPLHTHDTDNIIHLEYERPGTIVVKDDTRLAKFFTVWGKRFDRECIFDHCNGSSGTVRFFVNGKENTDFEQYAMHDNDDIEIRYGQP